MGKKRIRMSEKIRGIESLKNIVEWYRGIGQAYNDIEKLIYSRKQLVTNLYYYVELVNDLKFEYDNAYAKRKALFAEKISIYKSNGESVSGAEKMALKDIEKAVEEEKYFESKLFEGRQNVSIFMEISETMSQQISYLKQEQNETRRSD